MTAKRDQGMFNDDGPSFCEPRTQPLEVMIVGLSRTGTTSMLEAMQILGYGYIFSTRDIVKRHQGPFCTALLSRKITNNHTPSLEQFESILGEYTCISGEFVAFMAEELIHNYPCAKVILTIRDDENRWLQSLLQTMWYNYSTWTHWFLRKFDSRWANMGEFARVIWEKIYWGDPVAHGLRVYREHNARVKRVVEPKERLLVYSTTEGWEPLCAFLGKDVPDVEFPAVNSVEEHRAVFGGARRQYLRAWMLRNVAKGVLPCGVLGVLWFQRTRVLTLLRGRL